MMVDPMFSMNLNGIIATIISKLLEILAPVINKAVGIMPLD